MITAAKRHRDKTNRRRCSLLGSYSAGLTIDAEGGHVGRIMNSYRPQPIFDLFHRIVWRNYFDRVPANVSAIVIATTVRAPRTPIAVPLLAWMYSGGTQRFHKLPST